MRFVSVRIRTNSSCISICKPYGIEPICRKRPDHRALFFGHGTGPKHAHFGGASHSAFCSGGVSAPVIVVASDFG